MNYLDALIDRVTMYRLLLYYLAALLGVAMLFGALGILPYSPFVIVGSVILFVATCYTVNYIFAKIYDAPSNTESSLITALILALIITPTASLHGAVFIIATGSLAMVSKYLLAVHNKHIFNPAAVAVALTALGPRESASWWVGTAALLPFVVIGGLFVARKIRRFGMVATFFAAALLSVVVFAALNGRDAFVAAQTAVLHSSLFFLGFVMLTEPWTSPATRRNRYIYAVLVGALFSPLIEIAGVYSTPELALLVGNLFAFAVSPMVKTKVAIAGRQEYGERTEDIELLPERNFRYRPGQYIEMTLPHIEADARGYRRYFTLASSPTEDNLRIGVRYYDDGSTFKQYLRDGDVAKGLSVGQVGGDFTLPRNKNTKLAFIAGGIGVTPFRSMVKYLSDTNDSRQVRMLYAERSLEDIAYADVFEQARQKIGFDTTYVIAAPAIESSYIAGGAAIDANLITREIPDYRDRIFYVSGPHSMVEQVKHDLKALGLPSKHIKVDYFFGYA